MESKLEAIVNNWRIKLENDIKIVEQGLNADPVITDILCFHCQQAVEKLLKLFLIINNQKISKIHNIGFLLQECVKFDENFENLKDVVYLTDYAVELRYPDDFYIPDINELKKAYKDTLMVKEFVYRKIFQS